ncbi:MAG: hypothetical protein K1X57_08100 [Gemmataceae bacterium]|nr:hypothetical protein [Gemmataceae bacterium]
MAVISAAIPIACGAAASLLFACQGGFGGGHGRYDRAIGLLGLPAFLALDRIPVPAAFEQSDLWLVIWLPAIINFVALWGPIAGLLWLVSRSANKRGIAKSLSRPTD